jgi:two-component system, OmpR family, sensor kinase
MPDGPRAHSLRWRLAAAIAAILVVAVGVTFYAIYRGTGAQLHGQIDRELRSDVAAFLAHGVPPAPTGPLAVELAGRRYVGAQPFRAAARLLIERVQSGPIVTNEPDVLGLHEEPNEPAGRQHVERQQDARLLTAPLGYSTLRVADVGELRLLSRVALRGGREVAVIGVGEPLEPAERAQRGVVSTFAVAGSATLAAALLASYLVAARWSRPLRRMSAMAARVDAGDLSPRIAASGPHDEVRILADAFDHMLDRLEDAFARQRAFVSDASHELRTPLTVIRGQLEVLAREPDPKPEDIRRVERLVRVEIGRMQRLVDDLLLLARADERDFIHPREFELRPFVAELVEGIRPTADRHIELGGVSDGRLRADPDRVAQALRNVLVNAIDHTEARGRVRVTAEGHSGGVRLAVEDDGPGIPLEQRALIFDRFHRTDPARSRTAGGAGLGLAIVQAIVDAHGGSVTVGDSGLGGARIVLELPGFTPDGSAPGIAGRLG